MNVLPIIVREMRRQSRQWATYGLRVLGGSVLMAVGVMALLSAAPGELDGADLFLVMHLVLFWAIWIVVPLATADCISRERREGTLPLLLLTPLTARDIMLAKGLAHGMRALTLGVAAVPVMVVPFLVGGIDWLDVGMVVSVNVSAFCWALAAGLLATSHNRTLHRALAWSVVWAALLFWVMMFLFGAIVWMWMVAAYNFPARSYLDWRIARHFFDMGQTFSFSSDAIRDFLRGFGQTSLKSPWAISVSLVALSGLGLWLLMGLAGFRLRLRSSEAGPTAAQARMVRIFCTPSIAKDYFRRWMLRKIERNPIGWLERRTWQSRVVTWSWLAVLVSIYSVTLSDAAVFGTVLQLNHQLFAHVLVGSMALTAAGSFRRERESGVMELLMVSTLSSKEVIWGRLRGIWGQFLPVATLLVTVWLYMAWIVFNPYINLQRMLGHECLSAGVMLAGFAAVPAIGLYFSLRCRYYMTAMAWTVLVGMVLPVVLSLAGDSLWHGYFPGSYDRETPSKPGHIALVFLVPALAQMGLAALLIRGLGRNFARRTFALGREVA